MIVLKFGGTSVGSGARIAQVAALVAKRSAEGPIVVVVSAMSGVTDALLALSSAAKARDHLEVEVNLRRLGEKHLAAVDELGLPLEEAVACREGIGQELARLGDLATGVSLLRELSPRTSDAIAAAGETLSAPLVAAALRALGVNAVLVDPGDLVPTDDGFSAARPNEAGLVAAARDRLLPLLSRGAVPVTGGFLGRAPDGSVTTLGRGGSDFSAALLGAALVDAGGEVSAIEIWTDVDGILTADPRVVPEARLVPEVSDEEAAELAFFGAKVLHPATIRPAVSRGLPVVVRNTFRPDAPGTVVRRGASGSGVRALAMREGVVALFVGSPRMLLAHGFAARVFAVFEKHRVPVDVITTSEVSISITVDSKAPLEGLVRDLEELAEVSVLRDLAVISVVGRGLRTTPGIAARVFTALGDVNVVLVSQGASATNMTFVVEAKDAREAVRRLHRELFP